MELEGLRKRGGGGALCYSAGILDTLKKFLGSNEHLDWLKIDLNAAEIISRVKVKS